jgi:hypothetical protein
MKTTKAVTGALATLRAEYFRQLTDLAVELRPGFEFGGLSAEVERLGKDEASPQERLSAALRERVSKDKATIAMVREASPNNWQALDSDWNDQYTAAIETIALDLCVIAEAEGWTKPCAAETWESETVRRVPVRLSRRAA